MLIYWSTLINYFIISIVTYCHLLSLRVGEVAVRCCEMLWAILNSTLLEYLSCLRLLLWSNFWAKLRNFIEFHHTSKHLLNKRIQKQKRWKSSRLKALPRNPKLWEGVAGPVLGISRFPNPRPCLAPGSCWANVCWWPDVLKQLCKVWYLPGISSISPWIHCRSRFQMRNSTIPDVCRDSSNQGPGPSLWHLLSACGWRQRFQVPKVPAVATLAGIWTAMDRISAPSKFSWDKKSTIRFKDHRSSNILGYAFDIGNPILHIYIYYISISRRDCYGAPRHWKVSQPWEQHPRVILFDTTWDLGDL